MLKHNQSDFIGHKRSVTQDHGVWLSTLFTKNLDFRTQKPFKEFRSACESFWSRCFGEFTSIKCAASFHSVSIFWKDFLISLLWELYYLDHPKILFSQFLCFCNLWINRRRSLLELKLNRFAYNFILFLTPFAWVKTDFDILKFINNENEKEKTKESATKPFIHLKE